MIQVMGRGSSSTTSGGCQGVRRPYVSPDRASPALDRTSEPPETSEWTFTAGGGRPPPTSPPAPLIWLLSCLCLCNICITPRFLSLRADDAPRRLACLRTLGLLKPNLPDWGVGRQRPLVVMTRTADCCSEGLVQRSRPGGGGGVRVRRSTGVQSDPHPHPALRSAALRRQHTQTLTRRLAAASWNLITVM